MNRLVGILLFSCCSAFVTPVEGEVLKQMQDMKYPYKETMTIKLPPGESSRWKEAYRNLSLTGETILECVPKNQTLYNQTELITIQFFSHTVYGFIPRSAIEFVNFLHEQTKNEYSQMKWNIISQSDQEVVYEWILPNGNNNIPPQHEIAKILISNQGMHRVAYEKKVPQLDNESRDKWLKAISKSQLTLL